MNQMVKRIIMSVLGVVICGISVGMFKFAALGIDPFQSLMSGLDAVIPIRFGTLYIIVNVVLLLFALIFDRKKIGIATFIIGRTRTVRYSAPLCRCDTYASHPMSKPPSLP